MAGETDDWLHCNDSYVEEFSWSTHVSGSVRGNRLGLCCNYIGFICCGFFVHV